MADGARKLVENFRYSKGESSRHTGPSTLFRYLYQAGYNWLGAEQMYGPEEIILRCAVLHVLIASGITERCMLCNGVQDLLPTRNILYVCICRLP